MQEVCLEIPGPLLAVRVGGKLGPEGLKALARQLQPPRPAGPDPVEKLKDQLRSQAQAQQAECRSAIQALAEATARVESVRQEIIDHAEGQLLELALQIARKVVMQEIQDGRVRIEPIVREAMLRVPTRQEVTVHLNPDDHDQCQIAQQADQSGGSQKMRFVCDPAVARGECVVETREGHVESRIDDHFRTIGEAMLGEDGKA
ncbi:MAG: FliH/SctL family protein [Phycisphaerae bacterium]